jgi:hypothetical protein
VTQTLTFHRMQVVEVLQVEEDHTLLQKVLALQTLVRKRIEEVENYRAKRKKQKQRKLTKKQQKRIKALEGIYG